MVRGRIPRWLVGIYLGAHRGERKKKHAGGLIFDKPLDIFAENMVKRRRNGVHGKREGKKGTF
jgi:hypothetical protein